jgi:hypothetical protein
MRQPHPYLKFLFADGSIDPDAVETAATARAEGAKRLDNYLGPDDELRLAREWFAMRAADEQHVHFSDLDRMRAELEALENAVASRPWDWPGTTETWNRVLRLRRLLSPPLPMAAE